MCLILLAHRYSDEFPLVVAANRDEFYARPTAGARFWDDTPTLLAGRDLREGGTWLGITCSGRFAAVTNYRGSERRSRSRGQLTRDFLTSSIDPLAYLAQIHRDRELYAGFNLLLGDGRGLYYYSNREGEIRSLQPGLYGLANHLLDTPWEKVELGKAALAGRIAAGSRPGDLLEMLQQRPSLPVTAPPLTPEQLNAHRFIVSDSYGTCSSTVLTCSEAGQIRWLEQRFKAGGIPDERHLYQFRLRRPGR
ncbi:MAG TPA: NRDE family protein [Pseudomonadales bacterium]|nr:NRDE family protein [Pseudomonadales bacterium]